MTIFEILLCTHLIGDWLLQTDNQAQNKTKNGFPNVFLIQHCIVYTLVFIPIFLWQNVSLYFIALIFFSHMIIDYRKPVLWFFKLTCNDSDQEFPQWLVFVKDQVLHVLILAIIALCH